MAFSLQSVVPWGRSFDEYRRMFSLSDDDMHRDILGCADGPSSFNAEATRQGARVVSFDPIYSFRCEEIQSRVDETYPTMMEQARRNREEFVWTEFRSVDELGDARMRAMDRFFADYESGRQQGRYCCESLPSLSFADRSFSLAVCSHFLFLYSSQFDQQFHVDSIVELCRVSDEVRIFPLLELGSIPSRHVGPVSEELERLGYVVKIVTVPYEFQRAGNQMMVIDTRNDKR